MRRLLLLAGLLSVLTAAPAHAEIIEDGDAKVSAALSYETAVDGTEYRDLRLTVRRDGAVVADKPLAVRGCEQSYCRPVGAEWQGALAAWVADAERLGKRRTIDREMKLALRRGWVDRKYLRALDRFLAATGYRK